MIYNINNNFDNKAGCVQRQGYSLTVDLTGSIPAGQNQPASQPSNQPQASWSRFVVCGMMSGVSGVSGLTTASVESAAQQAAVKADTDTACYDMIRHDRYPLRCSRQSTINQSVARPGGFCLN